jgi:hypothetical protein
MLHRLNMLLLFASAWAWATLLLVGGAILATSKISFGPWSRTDMALVGLAGAAAGLFVFGVIIADRLFPKANRKLTFTIEITTGSMMVLFTIAAILSILIAPSQA